jgi:hypothetical protein
VRSCKKMLPSKLSAVCVCASATYCARQTSALFHVPSESIAALLLALASIAAWRSAVVICERRFLMSHWPSCFIAS